MDTLEILLENSKWPLESSGCIDLHVYERKVFKKTHRLSLENYAAREGGIGEAVERKVHIAMRCTTLRFASLHCIVLHCTSLRFIVLRCIVQPSVVLYCAVLRCAVLCSDCCIALHCTVLRCGAR